MIIAKDNKIIAVDKELLKTLNATLENVSSIINLLELEIASLKNEPITLNDVSFEIKPIDLLSIENIKAFKLETTTQTQQIKTQPIELDITPLDTKEPETQLQPQIQPIQPTIDLQKEPLETKPNIQEPLIDLEEIQKPSIDLESLQEPKIEMATEEKISQEPKIEISQEPKIEPSIDLQTIEPTKEEKIELNLEPLEETKINTQPTIDLPKIEPDLQPTINLQPPTLEEEINLEKTTQIEAETKSQIQEELQKAAQTIELQTTNEEFKETKTPTLKQEEEIVISFEDEFSEIEKLMDLSEKEAKEALEEELKRASEELGIDIETITELKDELFEMLRKDKNELLKAIKNEDYDKIHKIAHKLKGAALNLRLTNLSLILKKIDELSKNKTDIHKIEYFTEKFYNFLDKLEDKAPKPKIPKEIKELILATIQDYLQNQNEKKFQKDKKYIEKLLNVKINSIEDLQKIIKE